MMQELNQNIFDQPKELPGMIVGQQENPEFFPNIIDIALLITALISTFISLLIPCLFYLKKQCQEHPTVLIANISLLQSIANFNIVLMAIDIFGYQKSLNIKNIFHLLTFDYIHLPSTDQNADLCVYNYCIYMLVELLSISFHICYSIDLFITIKFPFFTGKKRRKYYYVFSLLLLMVTLANSLHEATDICAKQLSIESIYKVPFWFLITLIIFCVISIIIVIISFFQKKNQSKIRRHYIYHHRFILSLLVLLWVAPIWGNILIIIDQTETELFDIINKISFFCIISSAGVINIVRIYFDSFLKQKIIDMIFFKKDRNIFGRNIEQNLDLTDSSKKISEQIWNLPLSGAMNQFQSQQIIQNILQVVCEACSAMTLKNSHFRESHIRDGKYNQQSLQQQSSIFRNTIVVQNDIENIDNSISKLFSKREESKYDHMDPHDSTIQDLQKLCKKKRKFAMFCVSSMLTEEQNGRLGLKTVHRISNIMKSQNNLSQKQVNLLLSIKVTSYSHKVFQTLRTYDNITTESIIQTLDLQNNIENIKKAKQSLGASGSFFFFSYDHKMVIKTISEQEKDRFIEMLPYYFDHIRYNENSLFARTYGIYSIQIAGVSKIYFMMMQNTFKNMEKNNINYRIYDLKGSTVQRQVKQSGTVYKDINYFKSNDCFIYMSNQNKILLIDQITKDIDMLKKHNIMDYSLLLGVGKSSNQIKKRSLYQRNGISQKRVNNFRYVTQLQEITRRVYSISLIDYLQEFNLNKQLELWFKRVFKGGGDISSIGTDLYYSRFLNFIHRIIIPFNIKFERKNCLFQTY